jgi:hypothetical protein
MIQDKFNRTLDFNTKAKYFIGAWVLMEIVIIDAVYKFINVLINQGSIHVPKDFNPSNSYLARKVLEKDKASLSIMNALFSVFGSIVIYIVVYWIILSIQHKDAQVHAAIVAIIDAIKSNGVYVGVLLAQIVGVSLFSFLGLTIGQKLVENIEEEESGRFLGIKWYHYLWLWIALSVYVESILWLVYYTLHTLLLFIHQFAFKDILTSALGDSSQKNSFSKLVGSLIFVYLIGALIIYLMIFQRGILSGEKKVNLAVKITSSVVVAFVIPIALLVYTVIGSNSVR